ncbi:YchJ family metal-binding protein [Brevibacterium daeguense]|uniref:YchJ family metal-binding protein n=1 Tax=Brevibacterium daeguense TaxID=909936 RepID=A0ABP8EJK4_9MICO|nr:YchJ family metal-binding protein [Brevibacterium daeguense]
MIADHSGTCPCGGLPAGAVLADCCGPALDGTVWPETAEALMRSRYTAFVLHHDDHLFRTWHPRTRPRGRLSDPTTRWLGLTVEDASGGGPDDTEGTVTFTADWRDASGTGRLSERSVFVRRAGRWMYLEAADD